MPSKTLIFTPIFSKFSPKITFMQKKNAFFTYIWNVIKQFAKH